MEWLAEFWAGLTWGKILLGVGLMIISFAISLAAISLVMVKLPADYFHPAYTHNFFADKHVVLRWTLLIVKNIVGVILILLGIVMMIPGMPGPGVLTVLIGLIMTDIPSKRRLEGLIIKRPVILAAANNLRVRYGKLPLIMD